MKEIEKQPTFSLRGGKFYLSSLYIVVIDVNITRIFLLSFIFIENNFTLLYLPFLYLSIYTLLISAP